MIKYTYEIEIITMARPKKNKIKLTDDDIKRLKSILCLLYTSDAADEL